MKDIIILIIAVIIIVNFYNTLRQRYLNKHNKCARCGVGFNGIEKYPLAASYQKFLFCEKCSVRIKKTDMYAFFVFFGCTVFIISVYLLFKNL